MLQVLECFFFLICILICFVLYLPGYSLVLWESLSLPAAHLSGDQREQPWMQGKLPLSKCVLMKERFFILYLKKNILFAV